MPLKDSQEIELEEIIVPDLPYNFKKQQRSINFDYEAWKGKPEIVPVCRVHKNDMSKLADYMGQFCAVLYFLLSLLFIICLYVLYLELAKLSKYKE